MSADEQKYRNLTAELETLEKATGLYLTDECIDRENVNSSEGDDEYWSDMYSAACSSAGYRAEEAGKDINALIGRIIF